MSEYPPNLIVAPLTTWPGPLTASRVRSPFGSTLRQTLEALTRELYYLGASNPVMEVAIDRSQFRLDGRPRAGSKASHPGVVLSLPHSDQGPLRYACDRYPAWQDNLRAITKGLEALRMVERYGITRRGEQYAGFRALPPGGVEMPAGQMTEADALAFLAEHSGYPVDTRTDRESITRAYRVAVKTLHPDRGGDTLLFQRLQDAIAVLHGKN